MNEEVIQRETQVESAAPAATGEVAEYKGRRKVRVGVVVSDKMDKTVVVAVMRSYRHPLYKKTIRRTKKYMAHDEQNQCRVGDRVEIVETRPLSRRKRWRVRQILERAQ
ncbi:MAG: 30S ribosomal protein S17 [Armatimonadetes bacterium JP3_11]|jgi:small subunit ribosomal protein S17|nr:MAG: 30S ribosomal protein S17 [Armatimonadetes bacterium CP1_7O]OYT75141.1 MAG: 30S ribosomal protein S17 [Armatimonadetes bacterium JP3_11]RMH06402.1 MAG: 30S ribosomal protein S17 [Armatimonadota bacterium]